MNQQNTTNITIEGNIAAGKSILLDDITNDLNVVVFPEPIDQWKNWNEKNMLELMYQEPKKHMKEFQSMGHQTLLINHNIIVDKPIKIMERSVYSSQYVFTTRAGWCHRIFCFCFVDLQKEGVHRFETQKEGAPGLYD